MGLFRKLKSFFETAPRNRVAKVNCRNNGIDLKWQFGSAASVDTNDLRKVTLRTTDAGPFDEDVFFIIETDTARYVIPHYAAVAGGLLNFLQDLPGFDNEAVIESMACVENKEFICWEKIDENL